MKRDLYMSPEWLREQKRRDQRIEFHGVCWRWPVKRGERVNRWRLQMRRRQEGRAA